MLLDNSEVMSEFIKLAKKDEKLQDVFAPKNPHQEDKKVIEDKMMVHPKEDMIEIAHPVPVVIVEALGDGGLVENQNEQHAKFMAIINKMPTGLLVHRYASCFIELVKEAEAQEVAGNIEAANELTDIAAKLLEQFPFV